MNNERDRGKLAVKPVKGLHLPRPVQYLLATVGLAGVAWGLSSCGEAPKQVSATLTPTIPATETATSLPTVRLLTATPSATATETSTPTPTATATSTNTPEPTATTTPTYTPLPTSMPEKTNTPLSPPWWTADNPTARAVGLDAKLGLEGQSGAVVYQEYSASDLAILKAHLAVLKYVKNTHDTSFAPWFHSPIPIDNPLRFLQYVRYITNFYGKGVFNDPNILAVRLDSSYPTGHGYSQETLWYLQAAWFVKESYGNAWAKEAPNLYGGAGSYSDIGTHVALICSIRDFLDAKDNNGGNVISDGAVRSELQNAIDIYTSAINNIATQNGWH